MKEKKDNKLKVSRVKGCMSPLWTIKSDSDEIFVNFDYNHGYYLDIYRENPRTIYFGKNNTYPTTIVYENIDTYIPKKPVNSNYPRKMLWVDYLNPEYWLYEYKQSKIYPSWNYQKSWLYRLIIKNL